MTGAASTAGLAVEVLVEQHQVAEVRVVGVAALVAVTGPSSGGVGEEEARQATPDLACRLQQADVSARPRRQLHQQVVAVEVVVALQSLDEEVVEREPDGTSPVRVPSEDADGGLARHVAHAEVLALELALEGAARVDAGERADSPRREELVLVEQVAEQALETRPGGDGEEAATVGLLHAGDLVGEVAPVLEEPSHALREGRQAVERLL